MKVSIIVPIYNVEDYLDKCLESLRTQTYNDIEVLCINDGTKDNSQAIIDKFVSMDSRFSSYIKENGGLSDARNYGLDYAKGDYVFFIDSDDFVEPTMVEECVSAVLEHDADMVVFNYYQYFTETGKKEVLKMPFLDKGVHTLKDNPDILAYMKNAAWNKMYRKSLFIDSGVRYPFGYRHQDLGTTPKLLHLSNRVIFLEKPLYNYLADRANNLTTTYDKKIYHIVDMLKEVNDYYVENNIFETYREELKHLNLVNLMYSLRKIRYFNDQEFVMTFIDDTFDFYFKYFNRTKCHYLKESKKDQFIYLNKNVLKLYYKYLVLKGVIK